MKALLAGVGAKTLDGLSRHNTDKNQYCRSSLSSLFLDDDAMGFSRLDWVEVDDVGLTKRNKDASNMGTCY